MTDTPEKRARKEPLLGRVGYWEPKRATVALMADCHFIGTIDLIDGKPDPDSIRLVPWSVRR